MINDEHEVIITTPNGDKYTVKDYSYINSIKR